MTHRVVDASVYVDINLEKLDSQNWQNGTEFRYQAYIRFDKNRCHTIRLQSLMSDFGIPSGNTANAEPRIVISAII